MTKGFVERTCGSRFVQAAILALGAAILVATVAIAGTASGKSPFDLAQEADARLSDEQRVALQAQLFADFQARYQLWLADFAESGEDAALLPQRELNLLAAEGPKTLDAAVANADAIVIGEVVDLSYSIEPTTTLTIRVERSLKGPIGSTLVVQIPGGPAPDPEWGRGFLAVAVAFPPMSKGDRIVLFLAGGPNDVWTPLAFAGQYAVVGDLAVPFPGNPVAKSAQLLDTFVEDITGE
jgi:hypothetical protein